MGPERWRQIKQIYHLALEIEPEKREEFLKKACAGDESVINEVASLLAQEGNSASLFESPALDAVAKAVAADESNKPEESLVGRTLLHYRIEEKIGEGGMGVVYRARDTRLDRRVALKILPSEFAADEERTRRFRRESKATSALSHPNVATIYDIGQSEGTSYIVMEYVAGKTLDELIPPGGMRLDELLKFGAQIADGLAAAHEAGIVHRDLKPANVMVTAKGQVKVLDFGLAKFREVVPFTQTESTETTEEGRIVGTVAYMSPEQAEGKQVDARSDIFSLGSVLYEMATGRRAFEGDSKLATLSAILHREPKPVSSLAPTIPAELEKLISGCLRKDPELRIQNMGDVKLALEKMNQISDSRRMHAALPLARPASTLTVLILAVAAIVLIAVGWYWFGRQRTPEQETVLMPVPLTSYPGREGMPSFSPDGEYVAFQWCKEEGPRTTCNIYIKQIGVDPPFQLTAGSGKDFCPAWSPDGRYIAYMRELEHEKMGLFLIPQHGGIEQLLDTWDELPRGDNLPQRLHAWTPDSKWVVVPSTESKKVSGLFLLSVVTGEKRRLTDSEDIEPAFSPDGRTLAFSRASDLGSDIYLLRLGKNYEPQGPPAGIVSTGKPNNRGAAWTPDGDEILFRAGDCCSASSLWRVTAVKAAKPRRVILPSEFGEMAAVSRKGNRLAYVVSKGRCNLWCIDLRGSGREPGIPYRLVSSSGREYGAAYSPDGRRIAFVSDRTGTSELWMCRSDGSNPVQLTSLGGGMSSSPGWSPDGQSLAFGAYNDKESVIYVISANGGHPRRLIAGLSTDAPFPFWSADGQWIYFRRSDVEGNIWKVSAAGGEALQITRNSGDVPQESPDGKFLYFDKPDHYPESCSVWRMPVQGGEETKVLESVHCLGLFTVGKGGLYFFAIPDQRGLIDLRFFDFATGRTKKILTIAEQISARIVISPDGRTILYPQNEQEGEYLMLVENFR